MSYSRPSFKVQGNTFTLRPTSPRNVNDLFEYLEDADIEEDDEDPIMGLGEQYLDVLFLIADSKEDVEKQDLDAEKIDIKKVEYYMQDFLPMQGETESEPMKS